MSYYDNIKAAHSRFRETAKWKQFREYMLALRNHTCEFCGCKYKVTKLLNIHHKYVTNYELLSESRFLVLCQPCHKFIHSKARAPKFSKLVGLKDF